MTPDSRQNRIDEWVARSLFSDIADKVTQVRACEQILEEANLDKFLLECVDAVAAPLFDELWPTEADADTGEALDAMGRSGILLGAILLALTSPATQEELRQEGLHLLMLAQRPRSLLLETLA